MNEIVVVEGYTIYLNKLLGQGQYGKVYECTSNEQQQYQLCAKVMCVSDMKSVEREIKILNILIEKAKLNPNVVKVMKVISDLKQKQIAVIMEKCSSNLQKEWEEKNKIYSNEQAMEVFKQLLRGYKMLYDETILHRDIKPENILINTFQGKSVYKLADFGVGKVYKQNDFNMTKTGTPVYAAPEINQLVQDSSLTDDLKNKDVSKSNIDIFSIGIILYQLLFGVLPFETTMLGIQQFFKTIKEKDFKIPQNHNKDPQLILTIENMLKYYPSKRVSFEDLYIQYLKIQIGKPSNLPKQIKFQSVEQNNNPQFQKQRSFNPQNINQIPQINVPVKSNQNFSSPQFAQQNQNNVPFNQQQPQQPFGGNTFYNQQQQQQQFSNQTQFNPQQRPQQFVGNQINQQQPQYIGVNQQQNLQQQGFRQLSQCPIKDEFLEEFKNSLQFFIDISPILDSTVVQQMEYCLFNLNKPCNKEQIKQFLIPLRNFFQYNKNQFYSDNYLQFYFALIYYTEELQIQDPSKMSPFKKKQYLQRILQ